VHEPRSRIAAGYPSLPTYDETRVSRLKGKIAYIAGAGGGYAAENVRVNAAAPGMIMTPRVAARERAGRVKELADRHLLGFGVPEHVAHMAVNLASDESRIVTGQVLSVDSGISIN